MAKVDLLNLEGWTWWRFRQSLIVIWVQFQVEELGPFLEHVVGERILFNLYHASIILILEGEDAALAPHHDRSLFKVLLRWAAGGQLPAR